MNGKPSPQRSLYLFCLSHMMYQRGATNVTLSYHSGVSTGTIQRARNGHSILKFNAECILTALNEREFKRKKK